MENKEVIANRILGSPEQDPRPCPDDLRRKGIPVLKIKFSPPRLEAWVIEAWVNEIAKLSKCTVDWYFQDLYTAIVVWGADYDEVMRATYLLWGALEEVCKHFSVKPEPDRRIPSISDLEIPSGYIRMDLSPNLSTASGSYFNLFASFNGLVEQVNMKDVALSLSRIPRFNGHTRELITVADHTLWLGSDYILANSQ